MQNTVRVILFEDNKQFRTSLAQYLQQEDGIYLIAAYEDANDIIKIIRRLQPDIVLMDIEMPGLSGLDALREIKKVSPETKVLIQTQFEDVHRIFVALCYGASGYVLKGPNPDDIKNAIIDVNNGGAYFSPTIAAKVIQLFQERIVRAEPTYVALTAGEEKVLKILCEGKSYKMIANELNISFHGVHSHIKNIYKKLHANSAPEAIIKAIELKLIAK